MAALDPLRKPREAPDHGRHQRQHQRRQFHIQAEHHAKPQEQHKNHARVLHQPLAEPEPHRPHIRRQPIQQIARMVLAKKLSLQPGQVLEQIAADIRFHLMPHPQRQPTHPVRKRRRECRSHHIQPQPAQQIAPAQLPRRQPVNDIPRYKRNRDIEPDRQQRNPRP